MRFYFRRELFNTLLGKTHIFTSVDLREPALCGKHRWHGMWVITDESNLCPLCALRQRRYKQGD